MKKTHLTRLTRKPMIGFTLIELLVVVAIIAVLLSISIPAISMAMRASARAATAHLMSSISIGLGTYHNDFQAYPPSYSTSGNVEGSVILAKALLGYDNDKNNDNNANANLTDNDDGVDGLGFRLATGGRKYGPYVEIKPDKNLGTRPGTNFKEFKDVTGKGILYFHYKVVKDMDSTKVYGKGSGFRFNRNHNNKSSGAIQSPNWDNDINKPTTISDPARQSQMSDLSSQLVTAKFVLYSVGLDEKNGTNALEEDDLIVTGP